LTRIQWLSLIKLFELEVSVRKMSQQMGLSYRTVYRALSGIPAAAAASRMDIDGTGGLLYIIPQKSRQGMVRNG
jgi:transcriptional antiterminator